MGYSIKRDPVSAHALAAASPVASWSGWPSPRHVEAHQVSAEESPRIELRRSVNSCRFSPIFPSGMLNLTGVGIRGHALPDPTRTVDGVPSRAESRSVNRDAKLRRR